MTAAVPIRTENDAWASAAPRLSVLIPFLGDDPCGLIAALGRQALKPALTAFDSPPPMRGARGRCRDAQRRDGGGQPASASCEAGRLAPGAVELIALDDGGGDQAVTAAVTRALAACALPGLLLTSVVNFGRAKGRNQLVAAARADWFLFLDADMLPDRADFLQTYLDLIEAQAPAVVFGGFSLDQTPDAPQHALHRRMALATDCAPVSLRRQEPEKHVFTSNLLVRRDVFETERFDEGFAGWGWEDVEWAMRVTRRHTITHIDNTATHLGLEPAGAMARKYEQSAANFARVVASHRDIVSRYPSYRVARALKPLPGRGLWRPLLKRLALAEAAPLGARALAMRLYRAALYAEAV